MMGYDELTAASQKLEGTLATIAGLYQKASDDFGEAVQIGADGAVTARDDDAIRAALAQIVPPGTEGQFDLITSSLDLGFHQQPDKEARVPWSAFTQPDVFHQFDDGMWRYFGFQPPTAVPALPQLPPVAEIHRRPLMSAASLRAQLARPPFADMDAPAQVIDSANLSALRVAATTSTDLRALAGPLRGGAINASIFYLNPDNIAKLVVKQPDASAPAGDAGTTNTGDQALTADQLAKVAACLAGAEVGWDNWFVIRICLGKECALALNGLLALGLPVLLKAGVAFITGGISAAVGAAGGWVTLAILLSAAYWAIWIAANMGPNGVCLHIPAPWSFGVIGPGWTTKR